MTKLSIIAAILAAAIVGGMFTILLLNYLIMPIYVRSMHEVVVPDLIFISVDEAVEHARITGLVPRVVEHRSDPTVPAGHILSQDPPPGKRIKEGRFVNLVVSQGPEEMAVPQVTGVTLTRARSLLELSGLKLGTMTSVPCDTVPVGRIISTDPPEGTLVARGSVIDLAVSTGEYLQKMSMPNLIGRSLEEASQILSEHNLELGVIEWIISSGVAEHTVLLQGPQPGTDVDLGDTVQLGVSTLPDEE